MCVVCGNNTCSCCAPIGNDGQRGSITRTGSGNPSVISTDLAYDLYIDLDTGELWQFDGTNWNDTGTTLTGAAGAPGSPGAVVIYNSAGNPVVFASAGLTTIDTQNFTLETDGSYVDIENEAAVQPGNADNRTRITVGGVNVWENQPIVWGIANQEVRVRIHRVNNTTIQWQRWIKMSNVWTLPIMDLFFVNINTDGVADMNSNPLTVVLEWGGNGTSRYLTITKFVK